MTTASNVHAEGSLSTLPPVIADLRRLFREFWGGSIQDLADATNIAVADLKELLVANRMPSRPPTENEFLGICQALGLSPRQSRRVLAFAVRSDSSPGFYRLAAHPSWSDLKAAARHYGDHPGRLLHPACRARPFRFHSLDFTFWHPDGPQKLAYSKGNEVWSPSVLQERAQEGVEQGLLVPHADRTYDKSYLTVDGNLLVQFEPRRARLLKRPDLRPCRFEIVDVYLDSSPVRELFARFMGTEAYDVVLTRVDLAFDLLDDLRDLEFSLPGSRAPRRWWDDVLRSRVGYRKGVEFTCYDRSSEGGAPTRVECRDRSRFAPEALASRPNHFARLELWDLRLDGVLAPDLMQLLVSARSDGIRVLRRGGVPEAVRDALQFPHEPCHPGRLLTTKVLLAEVRRLASALGVAPSFFGVKSRPGDHNVDPA